MRREEFIDAVQSQPFRLYVSGQGTFDIRHPEMLMVTRHAAIVGVQDNEGPNGGPQGYPDMERSTVVDLLHVTRIEQLPQAHHR
jgi:hypothetical protein